MTQRCGWCGTDPLYVAYHDEEWGVPVRDDVALFEKLVLDGFQAGLSWLIILKKREHMREVFDGFDPEKIARYDKRKISRLLKDPGIIRNRLKVEGAVASARAFLALRDAGASFSDTLWDFLGGEIRQNRWRQSSQIPAETAESRAMAKYLKRQGFKFCGPTIVYAFMQAVGMVNDHLTTCFRHRQLMG
jgi:DNA-3-methyladenine glycosylase I